MITLELTYSYFVEKLNFYPTRLTKTPLISQRLIIDLTMKVTRILSVFEYIESSDIGSSDKVLLIYYCELHKYL